MPPFGRDLLANHKCDRGPPFGRDPSQHCSIHQFGIRRVRRPPTHMCKRMNVHAYGHLLSFCMPAHTSTHMCAHTSTHMPGQMSARMPAHMSANMSTRVVCARACIYTRALSFTHVYTHTCTHVYTQVCMPMPMYMSTRPAINLPVYMSTVWGCGVRRGAGKCTPGLGSGWAGPGWFCTLQRRRSRSADVAPALKFPRLTCEA